MIDTGMREAERPAAAGTEGGRRPTGVPAAAGANFRPGDDPPMPTCLPAHPDPQVAPRPVRRRFTKAQKLSILQQVDSSTEAGQIGAILRREGLYSSHLTRWREQLKQGRMRDTPAAGKPASGPPARDGRIAQLQRENARLKARLQQAELILEIQKKASEILGISPKTLDNEGSV